MPWEQEQAVCLYERRTGDFLLARGGSMFFPNWNFTSGSIPDYVPSTHLS